MIQSRRWVPSVALLTFPVLLAVVCVVRSRLASLLRAERLQLVLQLLVVGLLEPPAPEVVGIPQSNCRVAARPMVVRSAGRTRRMRTSSGVPWTEFLGQPFRLLPHRLGLFCRGLRLLPLLAAVVFEA